MNELKIIRSLYGKNKPEQDDCFFFDGKYLITTDSITENTHFKHSWSTPKNLANKLIEVNVSDIAASGGLPRFAFLNLGLSKYSAQDTWLKPFISQFKNKLRFYGIELAGGDTFKSTTTSLCLTLIGISKKPVFRSAGKINQYVYLTGSLGLSYLGYKHLTDNLLLPTALKRKAVNRHLEPNSNLIASQKLLKNYKISAMMDITDGLLQDSEKLAIASNVEIQLDISKLPLLKQLTKYISIDEVINSGEELELLFLSNQKIKSDKNISISCIGETKKIKEKPRTIFQMNGKTYIPKGKGFLHF